MSEKVREWLEMKEYGMGWKDKTIKGNTWALASFVLMVQMITTKQRVVAAFMLSNNIFVKFCKKKTSPI